MKKNEFEQIRITIFADNTENAIEMLEKKLAELKAQKEKEKWVFTEDEKVILRNLSKDYKWIARDKNNAIWGFERIPKKEEDAWVNIEYITDMECCKTYDLNAFNHIFQCIQWADTEPCEFRKYI